MKFRDQKTKDVQATTGELDATAAKADAETERANKAEAERRANDEAAKAAEDAKRAEVERQSQADAGLAQGASSDPAKRGAFEQPAGNVSEYVRPSVVPLANSLAPNAQTVPDGDDPNRVVAAGESHASGTAPGAAHFGVVHVRPPEAPMATTLAAETTSLDAGKDVDDNAVRRGDGTHRYKTSDEGGPTSDNPEGTTQVAAVPVKVVADETK